MKRANEGEIRAIMKRNTEIRRHGRPGNNTLRLVIDHQSFQVQDPMSLEHARWTARQLAIALARFRATPV